MDITTYARGHGILIDRLQEDGRWHRCPTTDKPKARNGAYMSRGAYGFVQNHATMLEPQMWQPDENELAKIDHAAIAKLAADAAAQIRRDQEAAAKKAGWIMHQTTVDTHPYLAAKGFPDELGPVWLDERGVRKLCIPMRADGRIVGLQTISDQPSNLREDGTEVPAFEKKFIYGQRTSEAVYVIDNKGQKFFVEGYATGLSVRAALQALKVRYTIVICFNAGNMLKVAKNHGEGIVIADNDAPSKQVPSPGGMGLKVAQESGLPFWLSDREKEDFNDFHVRRGLFAASQSLKLTMMKRKI